MTVAVFTAGQSQAIEDIFKDKHLGVATCANSVCHGKRGGASSTNVLQNEFVTWSQEDSHSKAYSTLFNEKSKSIAKKLNLKSAHSAKICLDCHADNAPVSMRGPKFQISDGVGCESCHGGSERWIKSHTISNRTHDANLQEGMFPTETGVDRAKLCLSCHLGTKNKLASHFIMGAGHPRLSFELETFTVNQPEHYQVDADYLERKGQFKGFSIWLVGQFEMAKSYTNLFQHYLEVENGFIPELSFFDCHSCHHPMEPVQWQPSRFNGSLPPGVLRPNQSYYSLLTDLLAVYAPERLAVLRAMIEKTEHAATKNRIELIEAVSNLNKTIASIQGNVVIDPSDKSKITELRSVIAKNASEGAYRDYAVAEQAFLAIESLTYEIGDQGKVSTELDKLYESLESEHDFNQREFIRMSKELIGKVNAL